MLGMPEHPRLEVIFKDLGGYSGGMCAPYYCALSLDLLIFLRGDAFTVVFRSGLL